MIKVFNTYYKDEKDLRAFINENKIQNNESLLLQVFSTSNEYDVLSELLSTLNKLLPDAVIIGASTDGEIMNGKVSSSEIVLSFTQFEQTTLKVASVEHKEKGFVSGEYLAKTLIGESTKLLLAFADGLHTNGEEFLNGVSSVSDTVAIAGGHAGDNFAFKRTYVFTKDSILERGAVAVALDSDVLHINSQYSFHWHTIGNEMTVTKAEGNRIYTINGESAQSVYAHYLGKDIADGLPGIGIEFPLIVKRNGIEIARSIMSKEDDGSIFMAGSLYDGEKVRIGFGDSSEIINSSLGITKDIAAKPSEAIFIYSCTARKYFTEDEIEQEILPLNNIAPVAGFFTYGEFFTSDKKELLNQTMTIVSLSESDTVSQIKQEESALHANLKSSSINALTHLINVTSDEVNKSNTLNRKLKERMELALTGSKTSVLDWNFKSNKLYISPSWKEMLGYKDSELENSTFTWKRKVHRDDMYSVIRSLKKYNPEKDTYFENTHRLRHKDGHWVWVLGRAKIIYDDVGNRVRMIGTHTDITQEKKLQLRDFYQSQMIEQINDSVTTTDLEGKIVSWNKGSEKTFGYTAEEAIGQNIAILYQDKEKVNLTEHLESLLKTGIYNADYDLVRKDKSIIPISFSLSLLKDEEGKPIGIVGINKDNTKRKEAENALLEQKEMLHYQAHHDVLTGLPNRIMFTERLSKCINKSKKHNIGFALFFIDLDKFKDINDSLGHEVGDQVLKEISVRLQNIIRKEDDTLARLSGDEFTIIMGNLPKQDIAFILAEKILQILDKPILLDDNILYVSGSIGISLYPEHADNAESLLKYADTAMYNAKEAGRNTYKMYDKKMTQSALVHMHMKTSLKEAISNEEEFFIHYQPQIDTVDNSLIGMEALIRWNHPEMGLLYPTSFISLAEETGQIIDIDRWVMQRAMKQISVWYSEGLNPGVLALNLSILQLEDQYFIEDLKNSMKRFKFRPEWLELEITEGQMIKNPEEVIEKLKEINDLGIGIAIDDFGTGYSSLSLLKRLPIHRLKIDKSFINDILHDQDDLAIVQAIIALGKSLHLELIAEGVETADQRDLLTANGCSNMQGYYFSNPLSVEDLREKWL